METGRRVASKKTKSKIAKSVKWFNKTPTDLQKAKIRRSVDRVVAKVFSDRETR